MYATGREVGNMGGCVGELTIEEAGPDVDEADELAPAAPAAAELVGLVMALGLRADDVREAEEAMGERGAA